MADNLIDELELDKEKDMRILKKLEECLGEKLDPRKIRKIFNEEGLAHGKVEYCLRYWYHYKIYNKNDKGTVYYILTQKNKTITHVWINGTPVPKMKKELKNKLGL